MHSTYFMQRAPVPGSFTGHPAQYLSSVSPGPQASSNEQALQVRVNYLWQVPRESLAPYVPLQPLSEPGMSCTWCRQCFQNYSFSYQIGISHPCPLPREQPVPEIPLPPVREAGGMFPLIKTFFAEVFMYMYLNIVIFVRNVHCEAIYLHVLLYILWIISMSVYRNGICHKSIVLILYNFMAKSLK